MQHERITEKELIELERKCSEVNALELTSKHTLLAMEVSRLITEIRRLRNENREKQALERGLESWRKITGRFSSK